MNKPFCLLFTVLLLLLCNPLFSARPTIAILPLEAKWGVDQMQSDAIYELLTTKVIQTKVFKVVERSMINKLLEEQGFAMSDFVNNKNVVKVGELLSCQYVVIGSISVIGSRYSMVIRLVDINTGIIEQADSITENSLNQLYKQLDQLVKRITSFSQIGDQILDEWGFEFIANAMIMRNEFYAAGVSLGISRMTSAKFGTGIWGGINIKPNGNIYPQGGVKLIVRISKNLSISANIGVMPSMGIYMGGAYFDYSPLWIGGYEGYDVSAGYRIKF